MAKICIYHRMYVYFKGICEIKSKYVCIYFSSAVVRRTKHKISFIIGRFFLSFSYYKDILIDTVMQFGGRSGAYFSNLRINRQGKNRLGNLQFHFGDINNQFQFLKWNKFVSMN